jgi:[citrate (pro-3S)-lyase] ligase
LPLDKAASEENGVEKANPLDNAPTREEVKGPAIRWLAGVGKQKYGGNADIQAWIRETRCPHFADKKTIGAIVMNCNPFTLGHQYLISQAIQEVDGLYIFVVEEDQSIFPFKDRLELVKKGTSIFGDKVHVTPSGKFIISSFTFPGYFSKTEVIKPADTTADVVIFGSVIAPALHITHRFVGEEPLDIVTNGYNEMMLHLLPDMGVKMHVIKRKEEGAGVISASRVRKHLKAREFDEIAKMVPETTLEYLKSSVQC